MQPARYNTPTLVSHLLFLVCRNAKTGGASNVNGTPVVVSKDPIARFLPPRQLFLHVKIESISNVSSPAPACREIKVIDGLRSVNINCRLGSGLRQSVASGSVGSIATV